MELFIYIYIYTYVFDSNLFPTYKEIKKVKKTFTVAYNYEKKTLSAPRGLYVVYHLHTRVCPEVFNADRTIKKARQQFYFYFIYLFLGCFFLCVCEQTVKKNKLTSPISCSDKITRQWIQCYFMAKY